MCYNIFFILDGFLSIVDSEEADSDDGRPPPADHPVREPDPAAVAELDGQLPTEWMRISHRLWYLYRLHFLCFLKDRKVRKTDVAQALLFHPQRKGNGYLF